MISSLPKTHQEYLLANKCLTLIHHNVIASFNPPPLVELLVEIIKGEKLSHRDKSPVVVGA